MIRRQRAALECPTFSVKPREFRAPEVCLAAILDCRTTRGIQWVLQETFLQICLLEKEYLRPRQELLRHGEGITREFNITDSKIYQES